MNPVDLAKAGFYYTNRGDTVECFICGATIGNWEKHDIPLEEHGNKSENCAFIINRENVGNIPAKTKQIKKLLKKWKKNLPRKSESDTTMNFSDSEANQQAVGTINNNKNNIFHCIVM